MPDYRKYGFEMALADHAYEGAPTKVILLLGDSTLELENYYMPMTVYEAALTQAGFRDVAAHLPEASPAPDEEPGFWDDLLRYPNFLLMEAVKRSWRSV
jgi:hypothetical protein